MSGANRTTVPAADTSRLPVFLHSTPSPSSSSFFFVRYLFSWFAGLFATIRPPVASRPLLCFDHRLLEASLTSLDHFLLVNCALFHSKTTFRPGAYDRIDLVGLPFLLHFWLRPFAPRSPTLLVPSNSSIPSESFQPHQSRALISFFGRPWPSWVVTNLLQYDLICPEFGGERTRLKQHDGTLGV